MQLSWAQKHFWKSLRAYCSLMQVKALSPKQEAICETPLYFLGQSSFKMDQVKVQKSFWKLEMLHTECYQCPVRKPVSLMVPLFIKPIEQEGCLETEHQWGKVYMGFTAAYRLFFCLFVCLFWSVFFVFFSFRVYLASFSKAMLYCKLHALSIASQQTSGC